MDQMKSGIVVGIFRKTIVIDFNRSPFLTVIIDYVERNWLKIAKCDGNDWEIDVGN